jgi:hypothetical protein
MTMVEALRTHWLVGIECDEKKHQDRPSCACAAVDLGWHPTVGTAVDAWIFHVVVMTGAVTAAPYAPPMPEDATCPACGQTVAPEHAAELRLARFLPLGDNHHNAAQCPYCSPRSVVTAARALYDSMRSEKYAGRALAHAEIHRLWTALGSVLP